MTETALNDETLAFYSRTLRLLNEEGIPYLVGGAYAFFFYTGIERHTKDLDIFIRKEHVGQALETMKKAGYQTEITFPHWLGKAFYCGDFIDFIYSSGNGLSPVDDGWFESSVAGEVLGVEVRLSPLEEMIWTKSMIMERERFDGADVAHILRNCADRIDWRRLINRFGSEWQVLLAHLILFEFIYPSERAKIPAEVMRELLARHESERSSVSEKVCRGTLLSRAQYII
jgi:hypothetical protein